MMKFGERIPYFLRTFTLKVPKCLNICPHSVSEYRDALLRPLNTISLYLTCRALLEHTILPCEEEQQPIKV